jgi:methionyl aminopeptidase
MFHAGQVNRKAIDYGFELCRPGTTLRQIDREIERFILKNNCRPAFKNYKPAGAASSYPATACISPNDVVVHGIPGDYVVQDGDLITIDVGTEYNGVFSDAAESKIIGTVSADKDKLVRASNDILAAELSVLCDGCSLLEVIEAAEFAAKEHGVYIMPDWCGHYIGEQVHMLPTLPNTIDKRVTRLLQQIQINTFKRTKFREGDTICLEPVVSLKPTDTILEEDQWTVRTFDGSPAAHAEKNILILKNGFEIIS